MSPQRPFFGALRCAGSKKGVSFRPCVAQEAKRGSLFGPALRRKQKGGLFSALRCAGSKKGVSFRPCVAQEAKKGSLFGPALRRKQKGGLFSTLRCAGSKKGVSFRPCVAQEAKRGSLFDPALRRKQKSLSKSLVMFEPLPGAAAKVKRFGCPPTPDTIIRSLPGPSGGRMQYAPTPGYQEKLRCPRRGHP